MKVKRFLIVGLFLVIAGVIAFEAGAADKKKLTLLTWNLSNYKDGVRGWIEDFEKLHPEFSVEWLDKKGSEWATFYQTQVVASTPPDIMDIQGPLWSQYAAEGLLLDLKPFMERDGEFTDQYNKEGLKVWYSDGKQYAFPGYHTPTVLLYNKEMLKEGGIAGYPESFNDILDYASRMSKGEKSGLLTLNFDWLYWPFFEMNGIKLLTPDMKKAAFNTPKMLEVLTRLAKATKDGHISKISWTGRWVEPNDAFSAGKIGMFNTVSVALFWNRKRSKWIDPSTVGVGTLPGNVVSQNSHAFAVSSKTKYPDEAWEFVKIASSAKWQKVFAETFNVLTLHKQVDKDMLAKVKDEDPLKYEALNVTSSSIGKVPGYWMNPKDAKVKDAFWPEIQQALLGQKEPAEAIADAERKVNRVLRRN